VVPDLEAVSDRLLRSAAARWIGLAIGLVALGFLVETLVSESDRALAWVRTVTLSGVAAFAGGFAIYHVGAVATLRPLLRGASPALPIWTAAQVIKYLPVPGSAVLGMVGSTVRRGGTTRQGLGLIIRHSLLHIGAATLVGGPSVARLALGVGVPTAVTAVAAGLVGLAVAWAAVRHLPRATAAQTIGLAVATWAGLGALLAFGFQTQGEWLAVAAAYPASWVVGQLIVPVPAGIGVREAALLVLLGAGVGETSAAIGEIGAATFALGTRLLHMGSDAVLALVSGSRVGWVRAANPGSDAGADPGADEAG
jgi:uncharacterized membrane protein YbhN (UPF0104 family)